MHTGAVQDVVAQTQTDRHIGKDILSFMFKGTAVAFSSGSSLTWNPAGILSSNGEGEPSEILMMMECAGKGENVTEIVITLTLQSAEQ